jgi:hypothetical protein
VCSNCGVRILKDKTLCSNYVKQATPKNFQLGPTWLTQDVYVKQTQLALASVAKSQIHLALSVSEPYSSDIQAGKRIPHPRHWQALAELAELAELQPHDTLARKLLVGSAQYILGPFGPDTDLRRYRLRLCERGGKNAKKRAAVAVARKLAVLLHRLWVSGEVYEPLHNAMSAPIAAAA